MAAKKPASTRRPSDAVLAQRLADALVALAAWGGGSPPDVGADNSVTLWGGTYTRRYFYEDGELFLDEVGEAWMGPNKGKLMVTRYKVDPDEPIGYALNDGNNFKDLDEGIVEARVMVGKPRRY